MKKTNSKLVKPTKELSVLQSKEFGNVRVACDIETADAYVCITDLCNILEVSPEEALPKLLGHISIAKKIKGDHSMVPYVDESGLYMMFLLSKKKDAIRFQDWLHEEFLHPLYEKRKAIIGLNKEDVPLIESEQNRQALRYMATASNVVKSGHFRVDKDIPELTLSHMRGWWYNPNDKSTFMLQFNCHSNKYIYDNLRMNVYLMKDEDGCIEEGKMRISFIDLDDDNYEFLTMETGFPDCIFSEWPILDFILEEKCL